MALDPDAIRRGTVVSIRLPRDKARSAVVVRSDLLRTLPYATILPITSELREGIDLMPGPENGLRVPSQVMVHWSQTVRLSDMGQVIGQPPPAIMQAIMRQMAVVLGIGASRPR